MRIPRVRFTVRWMMVVVVAVGLLLALAARAERLRRLARFHRDQARIGARTDTVFGAPKTLYRPTDEGWRHYFLSVELEDAAKRPWVLSDPAPMVSVQVPDGAGFYE